MSHAFYLAIRSILCYRGRAATIVVCVALTLWLPLTMRLLLNRFRDDVLARADTTPLVVGAMGSRTDLTLHALYFGEAAFDNTKMGETDYIAGTGYAVAIPLHVRHRTEPVQDALAAPIVGTTIEYFEFRRLRVRSGRSFVQIGECVLGSDFAAAAGLQPGDSVLSAPKNAFDLAGAYPLKMAVTGILEHSGTPDDDAVFTDLHTAWIIDGLGHGHQNVDQTTDPSLLLKQDEGSVTASAAVLPYTEITDANRDSFHFHGDPAEFPVTAILAIPQNDRDRILLIGRYASTDRPAQCLQPGRVMRELLQMVFQIERLVQGAALLTGLVTLLFLILVMSLSLRLRAAEIRTLYKLGCARGTTALIVGSEVFLQLTAGLLLAAGMAIVSQYFLADRLRDWLM